ncbi:MAG: RNA pyrophosphohydrolase [Rhodospirillales bacterium]|nr:RNA pyrophosphohydrolase [Rhodospirillales bacterium]
MCWRRSRRWWQERRDEQAHGESGKLPYRRGVGALLFRPDGLVFVARRIDTPGDAWQLPQGGIDDAEKPRRAVLRELKEETGTDRAEVIGKSRHWYRYDLPEELRGRVWGGKYHGQKQRWFLSCVFSAAMPISTLAADGHPEFDAWKAVDISSCFGFAVAFKQALYHDSRRRIRPYAAIATPRREPARKEAQQETRLPELPATSAARCCARRNARNRRLRLLEPASTWCEMTS